jgi:hypothetical protein
MATFSSSGRPRSTVPTMVARFGSSAPTLTSVRPPPMTPTITMVPPTRRAVMLRSM